VSADAADAGFDEFWAVYPRKVAKLAAQKAYDKAIEAGASAAALIAGAKRYAIEREGQDPRYSKHPSTWLHAGCWQDEPIGAPVIDQAGNVVAIEQPAPTFERNGFESIADMLIAEFESGRLS
jgi:hypothetical protein